MSNLGQGVKCFIAVIAVAVTGLYPGRGVLFSVCLQWPAVLFNGWEGGRAVAGFTIWISWRVKAAVFS